MKKNINILLVLLLSVSLVGCFSKHKEEIENKRNKAFKEKEELVIEDDMSEEEKQLFEELIKFNKIKNMQVNNGVFITVVTIPAEFMENATQEGLNKLAGDKYEEAVINEDGSVTYKFNKVQYARSLKNLSDSIDEGLQEIVDNESFSIASIEHNLDFTEFNVTMDGENIQILDLAANLGINMYSQLFQYHLGVDEPKITIHYYGASGNLIETVKNPN